MIKAFVGPGRQHDFVVPESDTDDGYSDDDDDMMRPGPAQDFLHRHGLADFPRFQLEHSVWAFTYLRRRIRGRFYFINNNELLLIGHDAGFELQHIRGPIVCCSENPGLRIN